MPLCIGIVGWGEIARIHASAIEAAGAQVGAIVSRRKHLDCPFPVYPSLEEMLPHIDAVTIAVPNFLHADFCLKAVQAGKAVMVEKPMGITQTELDQLDAVLPKSQIPVHVGYRLRWNPTARKLRERLQGIRRIRCMYNLAMESLDNGKGWTTQFKETGGGFFTLGIHSLDLARWLAGTRGETFTTLSAHAKGWAASCDFPLYVQLTATLPSGIEIIAGADHRKGVPYSFEIMIEAEKGSYPDSLLPAPQLEDGVLEYEALFQNFIKAAEEGIWDETEHNEMIQTHQALLDAQKIVNRAE